jgi:hypothetical protein
MSTWILIILGLSVVALIIGVILAAGDGGPRVTHIDRTVRKDQSEGDER